MAYSTICLRNGSSWVLPVHHIYCIPRRSRGYFGFGPVRRHRRRKLFGFRRLQPIILKGLFSYLVHTFGGLKSSHPSNGFGRVICPAVGRVTKVHKIFSLFGLKKFCLILLLGLICIGGVGAGGSRYTCGRGRPDISSFYFNCRISLCEVLIESVIPFSNDNLFLDHIGLIFLVFKIFS
jgi:hypothetical protein